MQVLFASGTMISEIYIKKRRPHPVFNLSYLFVLGMGHELSLLPKNVKKIKNNNK